MDLIESLNVCSFIGTLCLRDTTNEKYRTMEQKQKRVQTNQSGNQQQKEIRKAGFEPHCRVVVSLHGTGWFSLFELKDASLFPPSSRNQYDCRRVPLTDGVTRTLLEKQVWVTNIVPSHSINHTLVRNNPEANA